MGRDRSYKSMVKTFFRKHGIRYVRHEAPFNIDAWLFYGADGLASLLPDSDPNVMVAISGLDHVQFDRRKIKATLWDRLQNV